jgi:hypothetical protein
MARLRACVPGRRYGAEDDIRRTVVPALYCDFASMYPTVCTLMGLWRFVIAQGVDEEDTTAETQAFLDNVQLGDLQEASTWGRLTTLVQVLPDADIFPVRARYATRIKEETKSADMPTIGVNYLSANRPLWFTLADCVVSKLLTANAPKVVRAIRFSAKPPQPGLRDVEVAGNREFRVDPYKDDFYKRVIELRRQVKAHLKEVKRRGPESQEAKNLAMNELALKILANATSYGIFIELNVEDADDEDAPVSIFTSQGKRTVETSKQELPGRYYHPLLATLITGAARLMLALTERLAFEHELNWAFCDTDSMAFANTAKLPFDDFVDRVHDICDWFVPLNPYKPDPKKGPVSILEMEGENYSTAKGKESEFQPLFCFAISAKRYALFNLDAHGKPIIRRASAHGLGHYAAPYGDEEESRDERGSGVRLWEEDVWKQIISAALGDKPRQVDYAFRREMLRPAHSRYGAQIRQQWEYQDVTFKRRRTEAAREVARLKVILSCLQRGVLNFAERREASRNRFKRDFHDAISRYEAVRSGLSLLYGYNEPDPAHELVTVGEATEDELAKNPFLGRLDLCVSWVRNAIAWMVRFQALEQTYTKVISVRSAGSGSTEWSAGVSVGGIWKVVVADTEFSGQFHVRIRGISIYVVSSSASSLWTIELTPPSTGLITFRDGTTNSLDQSHIAPVVFGRVTSREAIRSPEDGNAIMLHNVSPIGSWSLTCRPVSGSLNRIDEIDDIHIDVTVAIRR